MSMTVAVVPGLVSRAARRRPVATIATLLAFVLVLDFSLGDGCGCEPPDFGGRAGVATGATAQR